MAVNIRGRSFLKLLDYTPAEIRYLLDLSRNFKDMKRAGVPHRWLEGKNIVLLFEKTSTRTRCSFEVAGMDLGMGVTYLEPGSSQMGKKESIADTARVLGRMFDGIEYRGFSQDLVQELSDYAGVPVWNGLTDQFHPTQMLADLLTKAQLDFLHPISGAGDAVNQRLFLSQNALGWPLLLFAELPPGARRRETGPLPPLVLFLLMLSAAVLALPTELAMTAKNLADAMLLPLVFLRPTNRLLALVGWMVGLLLALAISLRRGTSLLRALGKPHHSRPFYAGLAVLLLAPQIAGTQTLRHILKLLQPWLLAPGAALLLALVPGAILCQRRRSA